MKFNHELATSISSWTLAIIVVLAEIITPFKNLLKTLFTHHWLGKVAIILAVYLIIGFFTKKPYQHSYRDVIISMSIILIYYIIHYFT
ncbi:MAG: hypothetical protein Q7R56_02840 [Nanoarchaeota archaeon]|nr:hypothetical protein [Nanoarchaeota archaeon]